MHCFNYWHFHALLVLAIIFLPGFNSTKFQLDQVMDDLVEKLFGSAVQDEFSEFTRHCPDALAAFTKAGDCIADLNLSYDRIDQKSTDLQLLCSDLTSAVKCLESVIDALKSCTESEDATSKTLETVNEGMNATLWYFCDDKAAKLIQLYNEGFPRCFIRRPGRQLARCFPGRNGQSLSTANYWSAIEDGEFFNKKNCQSLRNHNDCAVRTLKQCKYASSTGVGAFRGAIETVMDQVLCTDLSESPSQGSQSGAGSTSPAFYLTLFMAAVVFHH